MKNIQYSGENQQSPKISKNMEKNHHPIAKFPSSYISREYGQLSRTCGSAGICDDIQKNLKQYYFEVLVCVSIFLLSPNTK